jgi:hypothetical protein
MVLSVRPSRVGPVGQPRLEAEPFCGKVCAARRLQSRGHTIIGTFSARMILLAECPTKRRLG